MGFGLAVSDRQHTKCPPAQCRHPHTLALFATPDTSPLSATETLPGLPIIRLWERILPMPETSPTQPILCWQFSCGVHWYAGKV